MPKQTTKTSLTKVLSQSSPNWLLLAIVSGIFSGICYSAVIPFVLYSLRPQSVANMSMQAPNYSYFNSPLSALASLFLVNCILILITKSVSLILVDYLARGAAVDLKIELYGKIRQLPIRTLEIIGPSRLINVLTKDIPVVSQSISNLPHLWVNSMTVVGMLGYLVYLNADVFIFVFSCIIVGAITYQLPIMLGTRFIRQARSRHTAIQEGIRGLLYGAKELKLNTKKSEEYLKEALLSPEKIALKEERIGMSINLTAITYGDLISFFVVGVTAYHLPYVFSLSTTELFGIIMVLLYIIGPMGVILNVLPSLKQGNIALGHLSILDTEVLESHSEVLAIPEWDSVILKDISYQYENSSGDVTYHLSPMNLKFNKGQLSFIVGGNGSGKSTLGKIISSHYLPSNGDIYLGPTLVTDNNRSSVRELIAAIYSDFYTFPKLFGMDDSHESMTQTYLKYLELDKKVKIEQGYISNINLSDGQKRRLALLASLLENREIYLFDEWAADQDPRFKEIFYTKILHDLKERNKIVIVITHDDRYFSHADQIIFMENGDVQKIENSKNAKNTLN